MCLYTRTKIGLRILSNPAIKRYLAAKTLCTAFVHKKRELFCKCFNMSVSSLNKYKEPSGCDYIVYGCSNNQRKRSTRIVEHCVRCHSQLPHETAAGIIEACAWVWRHSIVCIRGQLLGLGDSFAAFSHYQPGFEFRVRQICLEASE